MLLIDYPSMRGGDFLDYSKKTTYNILHADIYANSQRLIYKYQ